jgi:hypothetical protein
MAGKWRRRAAAMRRESEGDQVSYKAMIPILGPVRRSDIRKREDLDVPAQVRQTRDACAMPRLAHWKALPPDTISVDAFARRCEDIACAIVVDDRGFRLLYILQSWCGIFNANDQL